MNNTPSWTPGQSTPGATDPLSFAPGRSDLPAELTVDQAYPGAVVLLLNASDDPRWAADTAVAIAASWARAGKRVVLGDLHLEEPILHDRLGEENSDGLVDIFLYGASVARSARPPQGHGFYLIPAGTYTATPEDVYRHPRWNKLVAGFRDASATLLLFTPARSPGMEALAVWSDSSVLLGRLSPHELPVPVESLLAVLVPPGANATATAAEAERESPAPPAPVGGALDREENAVEPEPRVPEDPDELAVAEPPLLTAEPLSAYDSYDETGAERFDDWQAPAASRVHPATGSPNVSSFPPPDAREVADRVAVATPAATERPQTAVVPPRRRRRPSGPRPLIWLLIAATATVAIVVGAAVLRPQLFQNLFGAPPTPQQGDTTAADMIVPLPPAPPTAIGDTVPYVVQVRAYRSLAAAENDIPALEDRFADHPFYIVPELTQGVLYYKIMAGILTDTASAIELRSRLVDAREISPADARTDGPRNWSLIQARPLAFEIGEFASIAEAAARADSLAERGIPSYPAVLPYSDGSERWRLYGGAFADTSHSEEMRRMLDDADVPARLVIRLSRGS
jgi:hypothetical protein